MKIGLMVYSLLLLCFFAVPSAWATPELGAYRLVQASSIPAAEHANFIERVTKDVKGNVVEGLFGKSPILMNEDFDATHATIVKSAVQDMMDVQIPLTLPGQTKLAQWTERHVGERVAVLNGQTVLAAPTIRDRHPGPIHVIGLEEQQAKELLSQIVGSTEP